MQVINSAFYLPQIGTGEEIRTQYQQLAQALDEFVRKTFNEWTALVDKVSTHIIYLDHFFSTNKDSYKFDNSHGSQILYSSLTTLLALSSSQSL